MSKVAADRKNDQPSAKDRSSAEEEEEEQLNIYDEIEIEDMTWDATLQIYHYPCPCGDRFEIGVADLRDGEEIAVCPSCSLMIRVVFDVDDLPKEETTAVMSAGQQTVQTVAVQA